LDDNTIKLEDKPHNQEHCSSRYRGTVRQISGIRLTVEF
jgi:hypothetical protein